jgi:hypothetical protein
MPEANKQLLESEGMGMKVMCGDGRWLVGVDFEEYRKSSGTTHIFTGNFNEST